MAPNDNVRESAMFTAESSPAPVCEGFRHPLEIFPFFRRLRPSLVRDVAYTVIWNSLFALFFTALSVMIDPSTALVDTLRITFVFAQCIGFVIFAAFVVTEKLFGNAIRRAHFWVRSAYYGIVATVAIFPGYLVAFRILHWKNGPDWLFSPRAAVSIVAVSLAITALLLMIFVPRERAARAEAAVAREQARVAAAENEATTARMKLMEAQVEPHFLYNTLAHVVSLIDAEPRAAKRMIERLIALLRASAASASGRSTLGGQLDQLGVYLDILAVRLGSRLDWHIDVPASLRALDVPPMLLQPIVENAVKHGIEPAVAGGAIAIEGARDGRSLVLRVTDTGPGFRETKPAGAAGIGLANLRARLAAAFGADAALTIEDVSPHGTRVTLRLPLASSRAPSIEHPQLFTAS